MKKLSALMIGLVLGVRAFGQVAPTFQSLIGGTNSSGQTMTVGNSSALTFSGSGIVNANQANGAAFPTLSSLLGTNGSAQPSAVALGNNLVISSGVLATSQPINAQTGTTYALLTTDYGKLLTFNNSGSVAVTLSSATTTGFTAGYSFDVENLGAGTVTITPTTSTINGASTLTIAQNHGCTVTSDGTNYQVSACTAIGAGPGTVTSVAMTVPSFLSISGSPITSTGTLALSLSGTALPVANGGTGTTTPGLVAGTNVTITGSWPNQTINSTASGGGVNSGTGGQLTWYASTGSTVSGNANATISTGVLSLGASGTLGGLVLGNATSGTVTIEPVTGALGTVTASVPANTGTIAETNYAQTFSQPQTFSAAVTHSVAGAASAAATTWTGAPYTGGSATSTYPLVYVNNGATAPGSWSTAGTELGFNAPSGFTGNFLDAHVNGGASVFNISYQGNVTGGTYNGTTIPTSGTLTQTIASGTIALGTAAIASGACASAVTGTATGTATTDVVSVGFNGDPTSTVGYEPSTNGMLTIIPYPTANTANIKVCNNTGASVTPGAITMNFRVTR
jgi:hypothetical protein